MQQYQLFIFTADITDIVPKLIHWDFVIEK